MHCSSLLDNTIGAVVLGSATNGVFFDNHFEGNIAAIDNQSADAVLADDNYWGAADGPSNLGGSGDGWLRNVTVNPGAFLSTPPACLQANQPAVLTVNQTVVVVDEGDTAVNSGTFSDADGDVVTVSSFTGSVTQGNATGTWSWSLVTDDGPADGAALVVSADDGTITQDAGFTLVVNNVAPDASIAEPTSGLRGTAIDFTIGATDASTADQIAGFDYSIDWDGDGTVDETVSGASGLIVSHTFATSGATTIVVTATYKDGGTSTQVSHNISLIQPVDIDVKPGNSQNKVNAKSQGVIPVAIYTTADFDATTVVGSTVQLAGVFADHFALEDVDGDGDLDMILHFDTQAVIDSLGVDLESGEAETLDVELTGETIDQIMIQGFDTIEFCQPGKGRGRKNLRSVSFPRACVRGFKLSPFCGPPQKLTGARFHGMRENCWGRRHTRC